MTHTPGPWIIHPDGDLVTAKFDPQYGSDGVAWVIKRPEYKANARLIAAAPQLLEACKGLIAYRDHNVLNFQLEKADDFIRMMRIAIAAAEGGVE